MSAASNLFKSIPSRDFMHFYENGVFHGKKVVDFLNYKNTDVSIATKIPEKSIRYDDRMTMILKERLMEWATAINLVASFFQDNDKAMLWFQTPNPHLGSIRPRDMIILGRYSKLLNFIQSALEENN